MNVDAAATEKTVGHMSQTRTRLAVIGRRGDITFLAATVVAGLLVLVNWLVWLAWDQRRDIDPVTGDSTGPYEAWQVVGFVVVLIAVTMALARSGQRLAATVGNTLGVALCSWVDWSEPSGLYLIGVCLATLATFVGSMLLVLLAGTRSSRGDSSGGY